MLYPDSAIGEEQTAEIKKELGNTFGNHIDPSYPADKQQALQEAHQGKKNEGTPVKSSPSFHDSWGDQQARC